MKPKLFWTLLSLSVVVSNLICAPGFAREGGMVGNGGDSVLQEFNLRGIQLANYLKANPTVATKYSISAEKFLDVVKITKLSGEDHLYLKNVEVDAINYPAERFIEVSRSRWADSAKRIDAYFVQRRIALHEYLWIYGVDDSDYLVSNPIIAEMEKEARENFDPEYRRLLLKSLCNKIMSGKYKEAQEILSWGLELNQSCDSYRDTSFPMQKVLASYRIKSANSDDSEARISLLRKMLEFGADPNQQGFEIGDAPVVVEAAMRDFNFARLLFEFGANPNWLTSHGSSAFANAAEDLHFDYTRMTPAVFKLFLDAGGDVNQLNSKTENRSPARVIVSTPENEVLVETLIQTKAVDWCSPSSNAWSRRAIDEVRPEYKYLIDKYQVSCGRFVYTYGRAQTCEAATADAKSQCERDGYKIAKPNLTLDGKACTGYSDQTVKNGFIASYSCTDE